MSPLDIHARLEVLAREITILRGAVIQHESASLELVDRAEEQRRIEELASTRAVLNAALVEHFELSQRLLMSTCPTHGASTYVGCSACSRAARARRPTLAELQTRARAS